MTIGVLALQGAFREHAAVLGRLGVPVSLYIGMAYKKVCL